MKVLQINSVCGRGSTGRIATDLADILKERGHECRIAYGRDTVPEKYQEIAVRIGSNWDVRAHGLATRLLDIHGFVSKNATKKFLAWVEEYDPDVIHLHNIHGYYINVEMLFDYLKRAGKPVLWTLHDCWAFTGHCAHFTVAQCERWKTQCMSPCPQKECYPQSLVVDRCGRNFEQKKAAFTGVKNLKIVTPSKWLANRAEESILKEYEVQVIPSGIDLNVFFPTASDFRQKYTLGGKQIILGVANIWDNRKGLQDFLELSTMLKGDQQIVLVGLNQEQIKDLPENILGLQRTNSVQELVEIYSAADVFVNPSREETQGLTTVEALACGTPVITYNQTAVPETVDKTCGIVVECNPSNLLYALDHINVSADACLKRAQMFDKHTRFCEYLALYEGLS